MARLGCKCGHIIFDTTDNLPFKAYFYTDQNMNERWNLTDLVGEFIKAIKNNKRDEWIGNFWGDDYPKDMSDESYIADIWTRFHESQMYQCEKCNRLLVQKGNLNQFISFVAEDDNAKDIFKKITD